MSMPRRFLNDLAAVAKILLHPRNRPETPNNEIKEDGTRREERI